MAKRDLHPEPLHGFLCRVASVIESDGWAATAAGENATAEIARNDKTIQVTEEHRTLVNEVLEWGSRPQTRWSDYMDKVASIIQKGEAHDWNYRVVASAVQSYKNDKQRAQDRLAKYVPEVAGEEKSKVVLDVVVEDVRLRDTAYGLSTLISMVDSQRRKLVWFASGNKADIHIGGKYRVSGTVKRSGVYQDVVTTYLTRARLEQADGIVTLGTVPA